MFARRIDIRAKKSAIEFAPRVAVVLLSSLELGV
jgi:hypothetical protein